MNKPKYILIGFAIGWLALCGFVLIWNIPIESKAPAHTQTVQPKPTVITEQVTLRTFQGNWPVVIYGTEYYFDGNMLHIKDDNGYMQLVYGDNCILIHGWVKDAAELQEIGVYKADADYGIQ